MQPWLSVAEVVHGRQKFMKISGPNTVCVIGYRVYGHLVCMTWYGSFQEPNMTPNSRALIVGRPRKWTPYFWKQPGGHAVAGGIFHLPGDCRRDQLERCNQRVCCRRRVAIGLAFAICDVQRSFGARRHQCLSRSSRSLCLLCCLFCLLQV